jgi:hypothetical protein
MAITRGCMVSATRAGVNTWPNSARRRVWSGGSSLSRAPIGGTPFGCRPVSTFEEKVDGSRRI